MSTPTNLASTTRKALCLALVLFCVGAWLAPVANAQAIGDVIDGVLEGGGTGSGSGAESGSGDTGSGEPGGGATDGGLIGGVIDDLDGADDGSNENSGGDPIGELIEAVDKQAGDTTGAIDDATGGTVGNIGQTVGGHLPAAGDTVKKVTKKLNAPDKKGSDRPATKTTSYPVTDVWEVLGETFANANATGNARGDAIRPQISADVVTPVASFDDSVISQLGRVAAEAVEQAAFPIVLILMVVAFLMVQNRIDSKDPKLALAPVDSEHDLLSFT